MTDRDFNYLSQYEDNLRTAVRSGWARNPGRSALQGIYDILSDLTGPRPRLNAMCQSCVLATLSDAGKLYFAEKERREQATKEHAKETAKEADSKPVKPKAKKTPTKKAKAAKIEK